MPDAKMSDPRAPERPFTAPWQAQAFALAVGLNERGAFTWSEWAATLGVVLRERGAAADGEDGYWSAWLEALERITADKGLATREAVDDRTAAWERAAAATPHGEEIVLGRG